jgi:hypothetical protein
MTGAARAISVDYQGQARTIKAEDGVGRLADYWIYRERIDAVVSIFRKLHSIIMIQET